MVSDPARSEESQDALRKRLQKALQDGLAAGQEVITLEPLDRPPQPMGVAQEKLAEGMIVLAYFPEGCEARMEDAGLELKKQLDAALGTPEWRTASSLPKGIRRQYAIELYRNVLARRSGALIRTYDVSGDEARAEAVMAAPAALTDAAKRAFWELAEGERMTILDTTGPGQAVPVLGLTDSRWLAQAGKLAHREFRGRTIVVTELRAFIVDHTPFPWGNDIVDYLQRNGKASALNKHFAEMGQAELRLRF